jgi:hypothetical protein
LPAAFVFVFVFHAYVPWGCSSSRLLMFWRTSSGYR